MDLSATPSRSKSKPRSSPAKPVAASAEAQMDLCTPSKPTPGRKRKSATSPPPVSPATPSTVRRSRRLLDTPTKAAPEVPVMATPTPTSKGKRAAPSPKTPAQREPKRQRRQQKKRAYYRKVVYDGGEFDVGDDVYVKRREAAESDAEDPENEECRVCFRAGGGVMVECDVCLGGFHLRCVRPPLRRVPEGDWACPYCDAERAGKAVERPKPPEGKRIVRTAKEKLLSSDLWAARIESLWREPDGTFWAKVRWYIIPEETAAGRQPHNLWRELYHTNDFADIEMETILRHCYVMSPKDFRGANNEGDDIFYCEYEYDIHWHNFKRLADIDDEPETKEDPSDEPYNAGNDYNSETDEDSSEYDEEDEPTSCSSARRNQSHELAANSRKGRIYGLQKIGIRKIPEHVRRHQKTELEKAKATLLLATLPKSLPCRDKEMEEISTFVKDAICKDQCLGQCLYIHGVPGTGKTMSVLAVMRKLRSEYDSGSLRPYCFIEINGLKLASPENIYKVIYEQLSGNRVGWKKALHYLTEHFSGGAKIGKQANRPIVLLIDELDLLLTRNQSVLYNILDWPTKPNSNLVVIGIANTMDLPEKLLPRISSRMGIQRLCFGPYNYRQLQEIITSRLKGIDAFEEQAIEFASRKVAAMSGDARRALEICRRAAEFADYRIKQSQQSGQTSFSANKGDGVVCMGDIEAAIQEVFQAPHIQVMKNCPKFGKVILVAMVHELYRSGLGEVMFDKLATTVLSWCHANRELLPGYDTLLKICCKLGESKIILCEEGSKHKLQKLQLNYPSDDVTFALKESPDLPWLSKYL
ncbi:origin of replication complex subunit 1 [Phragmites australis]|uniref:origin of replication complex subunit 1 n=1 Tax=Phragmites australis TaxID=29695 RepID=UPI002D78FE00|nr:origin of replication complex subunit 1 [Phragmites australis]